MIAFATAISDRATYEAIALPGIERAREADSLVLTRSGYDSIQRPYNEMMDEAAALPGLEALVLLHQDLELLDDGLPRRVRHVLEAKPDVGLIGPLGGRGPDVHRWLSPAEGFGVFDPQISERRRPPSGLVEVDGLDGALMVASPWVVRQLRFGEQLAGGFHGYDVDFGRRVTVHGGSVICCYIPSAHRRETKDDYEGERATGLVLARMWHEALRPRAWDPAFEL